MVSTGTLRNGLARDEKDQFLIKRFGNRYNEINRTFDITIREDATKFRLSSPTRNNSKIYVDGATALADNGQKMAVSKDSLTQTDKQILNDNQTYIEIFTSEDEFDTGV